MFKKTLIVGMLVFSFVFVSAASAETVAELQAQIQAVLSQITTLQTTLGQTSGSQVPAPVVAPVQTPVSSGSKPLVCGALGDVNSDGVISTADSDKIRAHVVSITPLSVSEQSRADVNASGSITTLDISLVKQYINGTQTTFAGCKNLGTATSTPSLLVSASTNPPIQDTVRGARGVNFANFQFSAATSSEDVRFSTIPTHLYTLEATPDALNSCQLFDGNVALNTGSNVLNPYAGVRSTYEPFVFTLDQALVIKKGTVKTISLKCNVASSAKLYFSANWEMTVLDVASMVVTGVTSSSKVKAIGSAPGKPVITRSAIISGVLTVSTASSTAPLIAAAGTSNVTAGGYKFSAINESVNLQRIVLRLTSGSVNDLVQVHIFDGASEVGSAYFVGGSKTATSTLYTPVLIPQGTDKILTVKADFSSIGYGGPVTENGHLVAIDFDSYDTMGTYGTAVNSGTRVFVSGSTTVNGVRIFKSYPLITQDLLPVSGLVSNVPLLRFKITADSHGPVSVAKLSLAFQTYHVTLNNTNVFAYTDSSYSQPISGVGVGGQLMSRSQAISSNYIFVYPQTVSGNQTTIIIPAGATIYFEVRDASLIISPGSTDYSVYTVLSVDRGGYAPRGQNTTATVLSIESEGSLRNSFIWSANASSLASIADNDWSNGYAITVSPGGFISQSKEGASLSTTPVPTPFATSTPPSSSGSKPLVCGALGDVNGDGVISTVDIDKITAHVLNTTQLSVSEQTRADVNASGSITTLDNALIRGYIVGNQTTFAGCANQPLNPPAPVVVSKPLVCGTLGDVNGDGVISTVDIDKITAHVLNTTQLSVSEQTRADVNASGSITTLDNALIRGYIVGNQTTFAGCAYQPITTPSPVVAPVVATPTTSSYPSFAVTVRQKSIVDLYRTLFKREADQGGLQYWDSTGSSVDYIRNIFMSTAEYRNANPVSTTPVVAPVAAPAPVVAPVQTPVSSGSKPLVCGALGDVNGDGVISTVDIDKITAHVLNTTQLSVSEQTRADVNASGSITTLDNALIRGYIVGNQTTFAGCAYQPITTPSPVVAPVVATPTTSSYPSFAVTVRQKSIVDLYRTLFKREADQGGLQYWDSTGSSVDYIRNIFMSTAEYRNANPVSTTPVVAPVAAPAPVVAPVQTPVSSGSKPLVCGALADVNGDGVISTVDIDKITAHVLNTTQLSVSEQTRADVNASGSITTLDNALIRGYLVGTQTTFDGCAYQPVTTRSPVVAPVVATPTTSSYPSFAVTVRQKSIVDLYRTLFKREADQGGLQYWDSTGSSVDYIRNIFMSTAEYRNANPVSTTPVVAPVAAPAPVVAPITTPSPVVAPVVATPTTSSYPSFAVTVRQKSIVDLYRTLFKREADQGGLQYWDSTGSSVDYIRNIFMSTAEYRNANPVSTTPVVAPVAAPAPVVAPITTPSPVVAPVVATPTTSSYPSFAVTVRQKSIVDLYRTLFKREADQGGLQYWDSTGSSVDYIRNIFMSTAEYRNANPVSTTPVVAPVAAPAPVVAPVQTSVSIACAATTLNSYSVPSKNSGESATVSVTNSISNGNRLASNTFICNNGTFTAGTETSSITCNSGYLLSGSQCIAPTPVVAPVVTTSSYPSFVTTDRQKAIADLYKTLLNRDPDQGGLQYWDSTGSSVDYIRTVFMSTAEYRALHPTSSAGAVNQMASALESLKATLESIKASIGR